MTTFSDDLVRSLGEALEHAKGKGPAIVHPAVSPRAVREAPPPHPNEFRRQRESRSTHSPVRDDS